MSFLTNFPQMLRIRAKLFLLLAAVALLYVFYISGLSTNPPGFYMDESCLAYNAYAISRTGASEFGVSFPLYFQCYTEGFVQYANPTHIYLLALQFLFIPPSVLATRIFAATMVFLATILLGILAARISGRNIIGIIVALTAMLTPWLFELSRLVLEVFFYPLALVLFLFCLFNAHKRERWTFLDNALLAITLALITYSYTIGRFLGPVLAFGLIIFAVNRLRLFDVVKTWLFYGLTLIPLLVFVLLYPGLLGRRFSEVSYISFDKSIWLMLGEFVKNYFADISPQFLLLTGDPILRHHIQGTGMIFVATLMLAIIGAVVVITRCRNDAWWRFILFGLVISILPGALTIHRYHSFRLIAFPIFLLVLTVPALMWLFSDAKEKSAVNEGELETKTKSFVPVWLNNFTGNQLVRNSALMILLGLTLIQAVLFQAHFRQVGSLRGHYFDDSYPVALKDALATSAKPIYLKDGFWGPAYIHAYWYGAIEGIDKSNFIHLKESERPPAGAIVLSSEDKCVSCEIVSKRGPFLIYKMLSPAQAAALQTHTLGHGKGNGQGEFNKPRGITTDAQGNLYIADSGNARIQKFSPNGDFLGVIGKPGNGEGELREPNGVVIDSAGDIYVADAGNNRLVKFKADGTFIKQWNGPAPGFSGLSDVAIGVNKQIYILDKGRARVVRLDPETDQTIEWGKVGTNEGEFHNLIGIFVSSDRVFVTDGYNDRIQVFDLDGKFIRQWAVFQWDKYIWHRPDVTVDEQARLIYVTSGWTGEVLVYDMDGNPVKSFKPAPPEGLNNASSLALSNTKTGKRLYVLNTGSDVVETGSPSISVFELGDTKAQ